MMGDAPEAGSVEKLRELIKDVEYALVTTHGEGGALHSRPLTTLDWEFDGIAWFLIAARSRLADELAANEHVNVAYGDPDSGKFVALEGRGRVLRDSQRAKELWNPWAEAFFHGARADR
jgi:general stress protein 26